jgi:hypothetical protein
MWAINFYDVKENRDKMFQTDVNKLVLKSIATINSDLPSDVLQ